MWLTIIINWLYGEIILDDLSGPDPISWKVLRRHPFCSLSSGRLHCLSHWQLKGNIAIRFVFSPLPTSPPPWLASLVLTSLQADQESATQLTPKTQNFYGRNCLSTATIWPLLHLYPVKHYFVGFSSHFNPCFVPDFVILCIYKPSQFSDISENGTLILLCLHGDSLRLETLAAIRDPFVALINLLLNNLGEYHPLIMNPPRWIANPLQCRVPRTMLFSLSKLLILSVP